MKLQNFKGQYLITLPKNIVVGFDWQKHDQLEFKIIGPGKLEISKKKQE